MHPLTQNNTLVSRCDSHTQSTPVFSETAPSLTLPRSTGRGNQRRLGFTLVEMLVVISIVLLLIGMSVAGFGQIAKHGKNTHTKIALETLKALFAEYESTVSKTELADFRKNYDGFTLSSSKWGDPTVSHMPIFPVAPATPALSWEEYTAAVLSRLSRVPNAKAILAKLPADQYRTISIYTGGSKTNVLLVLDGYDRPILFCPSGGVSNVKMGGVSSLTFSSDGRGHPGSGDPRPNPNKRPFWISVGADDSLQDADDNLTSVEQ